MRVGVIGAGGRMGQEVCRAVAAEADLTLAAAVDPAVAGASVDELVGVDVGQLTMAAELEALTAAEVEVIVDFTHIDVARATLAFCGANGIHAVVGTSGFTEGDHAEIAAMFASSKCLIAPNFAIGAVLMMRFAELAAPYFDTAEIIELHHDGKIDAPSGTAVATAERMAAASDTWAADPTETETIPGARGAVGPAGIPVHSVRMRGMTAHQEIILGTTGQTLTLRHDSFDRTSFMPGVVLAVRRVADAPSSLTVGLDGVLDL
ncbi:MAG: 4-hydroxy-tetrahydrodipicolinate reductase [Actinomycetota bacterium]